MSTPALGLTILLAEAGGDRPAIITKVFGSTQVEACGYMPLPEHLKLVTIHRDRNAAVMAGLNNPTGYHAYWPTKV
jgi:hypothetical protein